MHNALRLARWFRSETARVYQVLDIEQRSLSDDERLVLRLPDVFTWEDIASLKGVQRSQAFDIRKRLVAQGLARDHTQRGKYEKLFHWTPDLPDFPDKPPGARFENPVNPVSESDKPDDGNLESPVNPVNPVSSGIFFRISPAVHGHGLTLERPTVFECRRPGCAAPP